MATSTASIEQTAINTIRTLAMDAVQAANSGHPGTPMALAPVAYTLWNRFLRYDPAHPYWPARDRFVLSCGHASMLLYSVLHLAGVQQVNDAGEPTGEPAISLDDIRNFRQLHSPCAGHPEWGEAPGIETTTGPLGQGIGNSVGMAMAARWMAARYNRPGFDMFGFSVFALCSDGDLMEGVGCEAASLAGHLALDNLCWIYDDNHITIEGHTDLAFSEEVGRRFEGLGWNVVHVDDANDCGKVEDALRARRDASGPTLIIVRSIIGYGSPHKADSHAAHGAPLGEEEVRLTKAAYGWPEDASFRVPQEVLDHFSEGVGRRGGDEYAAWRERLGQYAEQYPGEADELRRIWAGDLPEEWDIDIPRFEADAKGLASRKSSGQVLNAIALHFPWLLGGSADLAPSTLTILDGEEDFAAGQYGGRNFHFGVREHAMAATCNGMALCGLRAYGATFFTFTDYLRPSMRLSAFMKLPVLYVLTHDSIGLGEDGPTHQPIEHLAACRAIPGLDVIRPGDANEVAAAYRVLLARTRHPAALVLTRQNIPTLAETRDAADQIARGAYVLRDADGDPEVIVMGTGSELSLCVQAADRLANDGVKVRVVSVPCWEWFEEQDEAYRESVLPSQVTARVAVEAGVRQGWERFLGSGGAFVGMESFGASAPYQVLYEHFGITADAVVEAARRQIGQS